MRIFFRTDASIEIGTGHVMRCLTLADALSVMGAECQFLCRDHPGSLIEFIRNKGYQVNILSNALCIGKHKEIETPNIHFSLYSGWLGCSQEQDALECEKILNNQAVDWLIIDHYALDQTWEKKLAGYARKIMVIDDLCDRYHECNLLLDQNLGRCASDYDALVPKDCDILAGPRYALLRPEFGMLREFSLKRRALPSLEKILITMGGVDQDNASGKILEVLKSCGLSVDYQITVVMGANAPALSRVREEASLMPCQTTVKVNVDNLAQIMADSDLAIGAAGSTSWERCCLGLPTIIIALAENQQSISHSLLQSGAAMSPGEISSNKFENNLRQLLSQLASGQDKLAKMSIAAAAIVDGCGVANLVEIIEGKN